MPQSKAMESVQILPTGHAFGITDPGAFRNENEDGFFIDSKNGLVVVADGMGGHGHGKLASTMALQQFQQTVLAQLGMIREPDKAKAMMDPDATNPDVLPQAMGTVHDAIMAANRAIFDANHSRGAPEGQGMGTTIVGIWQADIDDPIFVFSVGDSRAYRFRTGQLTQLTRDDTLYQEMLDAGHREPSVNHNALLKAVGPNQDLEPSVLRYAANSKDIYLLCSDGLHGVLNNNQIADALKQIYTADIDTVCADLVALAISSGSKDNITVAIVYLD